MNVKITSYDESRREIHLVRDTVFGEEQKVPRATDWDGRDSECVHVVATADDGAPIGTGRILPDGRIGRLAVLQPWRGHGVGRAMLESLAESARRRAVPRVYLHSQVQVIAFYEKSGFKQIGEKFMEAGIPHVEMVRDIRLFGHQAVTTAPIRGSG